MATLCFIPTTWYTINNATYCSKAHILRSLGNPPIVYIRVAQLVTHRVTYLGKDDFLYIYTYKIVRLFPKKTRALDRGDKSGNNGIYIPCSYTVNP